MLLKNTVIGTTKEGDPLISRHPKLQQQTLVTTLQGRNGDYYETCY